MLSPHAEDRRDNNPLARLEGLGLRFRSMTETWKPLAKVPMTSPSSTAPSQSGPSGPGALAAEARRVFERMVFPAPNWVPPVDGPDGKPALDVLVIGAGMCGQTLALALARDGVRNIRVVDRAPRGREGPWGTYARMDILRSPKHL